MMFEKLKKRIFNLILPFRVLPFRNEIMGKTLYWNLRTKKYYQRRPNRSGSDYVEISTWSNIRPSEELWIKMVCFDQEIILCSSELEQLCDEIKMLKHDKIWKEEDD